MTSEVQAMERALDLARLGWGRVWPNPMVGAVLLREGQIVAEGYHCEYGSAHAEAAALSNCDNPRGATCIVNLEPCAHVGKTPACASALIEAGVARVVFGVSDPHHMARGGAEALREGGIEVEEGLLRERAACLNAPFLWAAARPERPFVAVKLATTLDGFIADNWRKSHWITGPEARRHVHWLRAGFDAVAVGRKSAEFDDARLTVRGDLVPRIAPTRVVFSRIGVLGIDLSLVTTAGAPPTLLLADTEHQERAANLLRGTGVSVLGADGLAAKLGALRRLGISSLLVEGGAKLVGSLLQDDLVDRIYLFQAPLLLGQGTPAFPSRTPVPLDRARRWVTVERRSLGDSNLIVVDRELCLPE